MLLANRFSAEQRRAIGGTLLVVGAFAGAVLVSELFGKPRRYTLNFGPERGDRFSSDGGERLRNETARAGD
jgi:hypothetical protein